MSGKPRITSGGSFTTITSAGFTLTAPIVRRLPAKEPESKAGADKGADRTGVRRVSKEGSQS